MIQDFYKIICIINISNISYPINIIKNLVSKIYNAFLIAK